MKNDDDLFGDLSKLRLNSDLQDSVGVKKAIIHIPVRKPTRQEFVRVHPDENMRMPIAVIELKEERETYLVLPEIAQEMPGDVAQKLVMTAINRQGVLFLWPVNLDLDETRFRRNQWNESASIAANMATKGWVKVAANMSLGSYEVFQARTNLPEPEWPDLSFQEIIKTAFSGSIISSTDHPVIKRLLGAI